ncbi:leucine-rich repeat domain-containing protein [Eubacterium coprostanoligenes]|uniref:leucine-rich repeat domain-containing protein n=1 Tax=Eubacterium coprostanoligenes TaxID=290054 RepID=UPI0023553592|nr:leucine-rich repeat domain-containing protein [Eubacterium coprostanoligenes]MCI6354062.1 leucine-rich repeat domain-containing protein [Eubacterium coprostanoligenes]
MKKVISLFMAFVMLFSVTSGLTLTTYAGTPTNGQCGENAFWNYDVDSKTLSISGTGAMNNYSSPWEKYKNEILTVNIEDGITSISRSAFSNCSSLKAITIPNSVTYIRDSAFSNCSSLIDITIPEGVTSIENQTFVNCSSLKTITIPNSVTYIKDSAFSNCSSLIDITIPEGVTTIGTSAFSNCSSLKTITIPNSVTYIGDSAFYNCSSLTSITIPDGVTVIERETFYNCNSLKIVSIPNSIYGIDSQAFYGCDSLETVYFEGYKAKWKKIQINKGNDSILKANVICKELKDNCNGTCNENISWEYNPSTKTMTFSGNGDLNLFDPYDENTPSPFTWRDVVADDEIENVVVSDSITYVDFVSFDYFNNIKSIELGKDVKKINISNQVYYYGFECFKFLKNINVSSDNPYITSIEGVVYNKNKTMLFCYPRGKEESEYKILDGVKSIEYFSFYKSENLKKIIIPSSVKTIGNEAFSNSGIVDLVIPDSVNLIENGAFDNCKNLKTVKVGNGVNRIETFSNCKNLESIEFGNSIEYIGGAYGENLKTVVLPKSLKQIGSNTFENCYNLKDVYYSGNESDWDKIQIGSGNDGLFIAQIHYNSSPSKQPDVTPNPGGSTGGGSTTPGGSTGGGGGFTPTPTPEDTDKKDEDQRPEIKPAQPTTPTDTTKKPASVKVNKTLAKKKALVVYWNKIADASGYQIQVATDKKFKKNKKTVTVAKQNASKKTIKKLKAKKKYFVRVRAYKIIDGKKVYGKWSKIKSVKTK